MPKKWFLCHLCGPSIWPCVCDRATGHHHLGHLWAFPVSDGPARFWGGVYLGPESQSVCNWWSARNGILCWQRKQLSIALAFKEPAASWRRQVHTLTRANFWEPLCLKQGTVWRSPSQALGFDYRELKAMVWHEMALSLGFSESSRHSNFK